MHMIKIHPLSEVNYNDEITSTPLWSCHNLWPSRINNQSSD